MLLGIDSHDPQAADMAAQYARMKASAALAQSSNKDIARQFEDMAREHAITEKVSHKTCLYSTMPF